MRQALPFVIIASIATARLWLGQNWGLLPMLVVVPVLAAAIGGVWLTVGAGILSAAVIVAVQPDMTMYRPAVVAFVAVATVTLAGSLTSWSRGRRTRELKQLRLVADAAQQVLLRPVPAEAGPVRMAVRYQSAAAEARIGGDLYEVITTDEHVRLVVGDVQGKGLEAVQAAASVLGTFREAAYGEASLAAIAARIETSLVRQAGENRFATAAMAEISADGTKIGILSCGHPPPLLLRPGGCRFAELDEPGLPLGLGHLSEDPRMVVTVPFGPGDAILFYTDGITEARNARGAFFPFASCAAIEAAAGYGALADRLCDRVTSFVGHSLDDDVALLVVYQDSG
jgi:serine phosphatase RsbU (regulator of sigma subunit)